MHLAKDKRVHVIVHLKGSSMYRGICIATQLCTISKNMIQWESIRQSSKDLQPSSFSTCETLSYGDQLFFTHLEALLWVISILLMFIFVWGFKTDEAYLGANYGFKGQIFSCSILGL